MKTNEIGLARTISDENGRYGFAEGILNQKRIIFKIKARFCSEVFDASLPIASKKIEAKAVLVKIDDIKETNFHFRPLGRINITFKNRVLHALAAINASLGDTP